MSDRKEPGDAPNQHSTQPPRRSGFKLNERAPDGKQIRPITPDGFPFPEDPEAPLDLVELNPSELHPRDFGELVELMSVVENTHTGNLKSLERLRTRFGEGAAIGGRAVAEAARAACYAHLKQFAGVEDAEMLCAFKGVPFSAEGLKALRAELCLAEDLSVPAANALPINKVAARLRILLGNSIKLTKAGPTEPPAGGTGAGNQIAELVAFSEQFLRQTSPAQLLDSATILNDVNRHADAARQMNTPGRAAELTDLIAAWQEVVTGYANLISVWLGTVRTGRITTADELRFQSERMTSYARVADAHNRLRTFAAQLSEADHAGVVNRPAADGPAPPNVIWWQGECHDLSPRLWQILNHLWTRESVQVEDLIAAVWGEDGESVADSTVRSRLSELNSRLLELGIQKNYSLKRGYIHMT